MSYNNSEYLPVGQLYVPPIEDFNEVVEDILKTKKFNKHGPLLKKLESQLSDYLGVKYVLGVTNGTIGLIIALEALHKGGSILTPRFSFPATMNAISMIGADVCFCDTLKDSPNVCLESLEYRLKNNNSISTILIPNLWSTLNNIGYIKKLADKYNVAVVYDSAQAFSCSYEGQRISVNGNAEVFSFHATKLITAFEGGCITTNNKSLYKKLTHIRSIYGEIGDDSISFKTGNGTMSELQAGLCIKSLSNIKRSIDHNKNIFMLYKKFLNPGNYYTIFEPSMYNVESSFQYFVLILHSDSNHFRGQLKDYLNNYNVLAKLYFNYDFTIFNHEKPEDFPNSSNLSKSSICLPIGERINHEDVEYISDLINRFFYKRFG